MKNIWINGYLFLFLRIINNLIEDYMEIPAKIKEVMNEYGMNNAELVGDSMYLLSSKSNTKGVIPTGLPLIVDYHLGSIRILSDDEALELISKL